MVPNKGDVVEFIDIKEDVRGVNIGDRFEIENIILCSTTGFGCESHRNGKCSGYQIFLERKFYEATGHRISQSADGCYCYSGKSIIKIIHQQRIRNHILKLKENNEDNCP